MENTVDFISDLPLVLSPAYLQLRKPGPHLRLAGPIQQAYPDLLNLATAIQQDKGRGSRHT
jgi:hypothetical protein